MLPCDGVVLAGGASRRMGQSKAELLLTSKSTLLDRAVAVLQSVVEGSVWISRPYSYQPTTWQDLVDERPFAGPLVGIAAALRRSQHHLVAVLAVDLPSVSAAVFTQLYEHWRTHRSLDVIYPMSGSIRQPLAALWHTRALVVLQDALADTRPVPVQTVVSRLASDWIEVPENVLININSPQDWAKFRQQRLDE